MSAISMVLLAPIVASHIQFLSSPLTFVLVYVWSRRNPYIRMNFLGLFNFTAPYLPWVLMGFTVLIHNHFPSGDLLGMGIGHVYYFFEDVYPRMPGSNGRKILATPSIIKTIATFNFNRNSTNAEIPAEIDAGEPAVAPTATFSPTAAAAATSTASNSDSGSSAGSGSGWVDVGNESTGGNDSPSATANELRQRNQTTTTATAVNNDDE